MGAGPEEASAYVAGERRAANSQQDVSVRWNRIIDASYCLV